MKSDISILFRALFILLVQNNGTFRNSSLYSVIDPQWGAMAQRHETFHNVPKFNTSSGVIIELSYRCVQRVLHTRGSLLFRRAALIPAAYSLREVRVVELFAF